MLGAEAPLARKATPAVQARATFRSMMIWAHRWAGLAIAAMLLVVGLTGAVLPYATPLSHRLAPDIWRASPPKPGARVLSGVELKHRVEEQTGGVVTYMPLKLDPKFAQAVFLKANPYGHRLPYGEVIADPYTGEIRMHVTYGALSAGPVNYVPFLVKVHYSLAAGPTGVLVFGIASLVWFLNCLAGLWLTLPRRRAVNAAAKGWWSRWASAWRVRTGAGGPALNLDLHRAGGLWLFPVLLVFAWSGVAFNLAQVHTPVQRFLGAEGLYRPLQNPEPEGAWPMTFEAAVEHGRGLMDAQAKRDGFTVRTGYAITINEAAHAYGYYARTSLDGTAEQGSTVVWFDAASGQQLRFDPPYGRTLADHLDKWTRQLHTASIWGWPWRLLVSIVGLLVTVMTVTGCIMWLRSQFLRR